ncbi:hypothetical protein BDK51DRAFT_21228 [Blyttiomyces helicus]|uniref:Zn(2)-C6 fungal-type domain-containing protein n=1 Tax=Blyttiomyces helicus TaxID=388810 RepID=A0A4P9WF14_9FUNG|nr:hypothetical protein BDK51DRAFT_21228 [Blyttiomyces helicus]|eukprot:RKO89888.1 hypothetical protein BDK51DRAFT_21228 [Blyttiomyces helicus]
MTQLASIASSAPALDISKLPRKRKQVKNACVNCQKACKKCEIVRPCPRCVKYGLSDSCSDSMRKERKKRMLIIIAFLAYLLPLLHELLRYISASVSRVRYTHPLPPLPPRTQHSAQEKGIEARTPLVPALSWPSALFTRPLETSESFLSFAVNAHHERFSHRALLQ